MVGREDLSIFSEHERRNAKQSERLAGGAGLLQLHAGRDKRCPGQMRVHFVEGCKLLC